MGSGDCCEKGEKYRKFNMLPKSIFVFVNERLPAPLAFTRRRTASSSAPGQSVDATVATLVGDLLVTKPRAALRQSPRFLRDVS